MKHIQNPSIISGGSAANTAVGYNSFGGKCCFIGQIGNDKFGDLFSKDLNNSGVLFQNKDLQLPEKTSKSIVLVTPDAERSMNTFLGASNKFNIKSFDKQFIIITCLWCGTNCLVSSSFICFFSENYEFNKTIQ